MRRNGWIFLEVLVATNVVGILAVVLATAVGAHQKAINHLADTRAASRLAESAILSMQSGQSPLPRGEDQSVAIHPISQATYFSGMSWVEIDASFHGRRAALIGLVPTGSTPGGGK